jgi:hypothetical protein
MALNDTVFATNLKNLFDKMEKLQPGNIPMTKQQVADELAALIDAQIKTLTVTMVIPASAVLVDVEGQATGVPNTSPLGLTQVSVT